MSVFGGNNSTWKQRNIHTFRFHKFSAFDFYQNLNDDAVSFRIDICRESGRGTMCPTY